MNPTTLKSDEEDVDVVAGAAPRPIELASVQVAPALLRYARAHFRVA